MSRFLDPAKISASAMESTRGYRKREREYSKWAEEAAARGDAEAYRKYHAEAMRAHRLKWSSFATAVAYQETSNAVR